ncbi:MAG: exo-alpha-sialidase [Verrucomicrobia bacterium]|nr:exo-alpha-sialidase [Verrucomicrobiota bacterium]
MFFLFRNVMSRRAIVAGAVFALAAFAIPPSWAGQAGPIYLLPGAEYYVAIDNVCAWPNLKRLPGGELAVAIYNKPEHGMLCGDIELWVSSDEGRSWVRRSTISDHSEDPELVRMNHAMGLAPDGSLVALISGWSKGRKLPLLPVQICISRDQGRTWQRSICPDLAIAKLVPHGDIVADPEGTLTASLYGSQPDPSAPRGARAHSMTVRSRDHGRTWTDLSLLTQDGGETSLLQSRSGKWFAAVRREGQMELAVAGTTASVALFTSSDDRRTWQPNELPLSLPGQHPGHLLELKDGRLLVSYGSRITGMYGVCARVSDDQGKTWSRPKILISAPGPLDSGYPSTVELDDGTLVTAYYAGPRSVAFARKYSPYGMPWHQRYHMGICRWKPVDFEFVR